MNAANQVKEKIIVALDTNDLDEAIEWIETLSPYVGCFKIGLEFIYSILKQLIKMDSGVAVSNLDKIRHLFEMYNDQIFLDGKLLDISNTVEGAVRVITKIGVRMFNLHCLGGSAMMKAAKKTAEEEAERIGISRPLILGVTLLTSLGYDDLVEMGICDEVNYTDPEELRSAQRDRIERLVVHLALLAQECGLDGVIASPQEIKAIRESCQPELLIVTPGVRPEWAAAGDQKRIMTPSRAIIAGADYLVMGRPITNPPADIGSSVDAVERIHKEIIEAIGV